MYPLQGQEGGVGHWQKHQENNDFLTFSHIWWVVILLVSLTSTSSPDPGSKWYIASWPMLRSYQSSTLWWCCASSAFHVSLCGLSSFLFAVHQLKKGGSVCRQCVASRFSLKNVTGAHSSRIKHQFGSRFKMDQGGAIPAVAAEGKTPCSFLSRYKNLLAASMVISATKRSAPSKA